MEVSELCKLCNKYADDAVECKECGLWVHFSCAKINDKLKYELLNRPSLEHLCTSCYLDRKNLFSFQECFERINSAFSLSEHYFAYICLNEEMLLPEKCFEESATPFVDEKLHFPSMYIMEKINIFSEFLPINSSNGADSIFNSVSLALVGDRTLSCELKVRTIIELSKICYKQCDDVSLNFELYSGYSPLETVEQIIYDINLCSPWSIYGVAYAAGVNIRSIYPCVNITDSSTETFNFTIQAVSDDSITLNILWTISDFEYIMNEYYFPKMFVPLIERKNLPWELHPKLFPHNGNKSFLPNEKYFKTLN